MVAGVNVSDCFWYQLTRVILNKRAIKWLLLLLKIKNQKKTNVLSDIECMTMGQKAASK